MKLRDKILKRALSVFLLVACIAIFGPANGTTNKQALPEGSKFSASASTGEDYEVHRDKDGFLEGRNYRNGSLWVVLFIQVLPGQDDTYFNYLASTWKKQQEALKKEGVILSYKILQSAQGSKKDYNVMMMTEYKDRATLDENQYRMEAIINSVQGGSDEVTMAGYRDRGKVRTIFGGKISREIIFR